MGALATKVLRPIKSFNIENRAHREIAKEHRSVAPKYEANVEDLKRTLEAVPDLDDKLHRKDPGLDDRLKNIYVTSTGRPEDDITRELQSKTEANKLLPQNRNMPEVFEYGYKEPEKVTYGKTTLKRVINFVSAHQADPSNVTAENIALEYKMKSEDVENILKYFKTFEVYVPGTKQGPATFAGPAQFRKLQEERKKMIEEKSSSDTDVVIKEAEKN